MLANDTDVDGDSLIATVAGSPAHGTLVLNADGSFVYSPTAGYSGPDSFSYTVADGAGGASEATVSIDILPFNQAPVAGDDAYDLLEDGVLDIAAAGVLANDSDVDGDVLRAVRVTSPARGSLVLNANGSFTYTPNANFGGLDGFTYRANDGLLDSNTVTVSIQVAAVNDIPVATADAYATNQDTPLNVLARGVLNNDVDEDGETLTAVLAAGPAHGAVTLNADGSFLYTPTAGYSGADSFTYQAADASSSIAGRTVGTDRVDARELTDRLMERLDDRLTDSRSGRSGAERADRAERSSRRRNDDAIADLLADESFTSDAVIDAMAAGKRTDDDSIGAIFSSWDDAGLSRRRNASRVKDLEVRCTKCQPQVLALIKH